MLDGATARARDTMNTIPDLTVKTTFMKLRPSLTTYKVCYINQINAVVRVAAFNLIVLSTNYTSSYIYF